MVGLSVKGPVHRSWLAFFIVRDRALQAIGYVIIGTSNRVTTLNMPHIRPLEGKLWEMRMTGRDGIARAVYVARTGQRLTVLHVFTKKTQKTPRKAIETAQARLRSLTDD